MEKIIALLISIISLTGIFWYKENINGMPVKRWWVSIIIFITSIIYGLFLNTF